MKLNQLFATFIACLVASLAYAGTPEQESAFVEAYKAAYETGDKPKLQSFLYVKDANPMALEFYSANRRIANARMKAELGLTLLHPTYREGLRAILAAEAGNA